MFLFYIAVALPGSILFEQATSAEGIPAKLAGIAQNVPQVHLAVLLSLLPPFISWTLAVTLYAITRHQDPDLALLALSCRFGEGVINVTYTFAMLGMLWLATGAAAPAPDTAATQALAALLLKVRGWAYLVGATVFAVGSTLFSYLFLRARSIPIWLAWLGIVGSVLLVVGLPLELLRFVKGPVTMYMWGPLAVFEVVLGLWLLIKGVAPPSARRRLSTNED
jgi:hypothetical protein